MSSDIWLGQGSGVLTTRLMCSRSKIDIDKYIFLLTGTIATVDKSFNLNSSLESIKYNIIRVETCMLLHPITSASGACGF